jgi:hypothetical protein
VSKIRAMTPVALVAYQSGLTVLVTAQEAPEDVTGAAGVLEGGCAGGTSWWVDGAEEDGELVFAVGAWLAAGLLALPCPDDAVLA